MSVCTHVKSYLQRGGCRDLGARETVLQTNCYLQTQGPLHPNCISPSQKPGIMTWTAQFHAFRTAQLLPFQIAQVLPSRMACLPPSQKPGFASLTAQPLASRTALVEGKETSIQNIHILCGSHCTGEHKDWCCASRGNTCPTMSFSGMLIHLSYGRTACIISPYYIMEGITLSLPLSAAL